MTNRSTPDRYPFGCAPARWLEKNSRGRDSGVKEHRGSLPDDRSESGHALFEARALVRRTARQCAILSGALALCAEPRRDSLVAPELLSIGRLQADMVAEIGSLFRKDGKLIDGAFFYCVFRHAAAQCLRELVIRAGEKIIAERDRATAERRCEKPAREIEATPRWRTRGWLALLGALAVAAYGFCDTSRMGADAVEFFSNESQSP